MGSRHDYYTGGIELLGVSGSIKIFKGSIAKVVFVANREEFMLTQKLPQFFLSLALWAF